MSRASSRPFTVADIETLPAVCGWQELCRIFSISRSRFYELDQEGAFDRFKLRPGVGPKRFAGALIQAYLLGRPTELWTRRRRPAKASIRTDAMKLSGEAKWCRDEEADSHMSEMWPAD